MFTITDASDTKLLAEADGIEAARFAARTMHDEGEPLPILIYDGRGHFPVERLIEGPNGAMLSGAMLRGYGS